jgi:hypothetical protein
VKGDLAFDRVGQSRPAPPGFELLLRMGENDDQLVTDWEGNNVDRIDRSD